MSHFVARLYQALVLRHPLLIIVLMLTILGGFSLYIPDFKLDASADSLLLDNDPDLLRYREITKRYDTGDHLVLTISSDSDLFGDEVISRLIGLREALLALPRIPSVTSYLDVPLTQNKGGNLSDLADGAPRLADPDTDRAKARKELMTSPVYRNLVLSADGSTTAMLISLSENPQVAALREQRDALRQRIRDNQASAGDRATLSNIEARYDAATRERDELRHQDIVTIRAIMAQYQGANPGGVSLDLHLGGVPMIADDMISYIQRDLNVFGIGIFLFLVLTLGLIFRKLRWVVLPLLSCVFAGTLMIGLLGLAGWRVTVISSNFISLMLIITMSMNIHLVVRYRQLRADFPDHDQQRLIFDTARLMVWPCIYTALTTILAFASLVVSGIKPVIDFGWMMTLGLIVVFITTFTLFPALLALLPKGEIETERQSRFQLTRALADFTDRHGKAILLSSLVLAVISAVGITRLKVENSFIDYFSKDTEIYQGMKLIDQKLGGTTPLDIIVHFDTPASDANSDPNPNPGQTDSENLADTGQANADDAFMDDFSDDFMEDAVPSEGSAASGSSSDWFTPFKIDRIKAVHDYLDAQPEIGKVLSFASVIRVAEALNDGKTFNAFEMSLMQRLIPDDIKTIMIDPFVSVEANEARINVRILDSQPNLRRNELLARLKTGLHKDLGLTDNQVEVTGVLVLYNNMLQSLFQSQILTLGAVMVGILGMLLVLFRNVKLAIIGIIPNILAAAIILGLMGLLGIPLDLMTITIAAITIGIAVDNAIHYIYRFREELPRWNGDYLTTMHHCHANIGTAVFYTAITIILGFSILVLSNFIPSIYFGLLTALAMTIALFAALTLLPRLILLWRPFG